MASALRKFLAALSVDHDLLRRFIDDPEGLMACSGLSDSERRAMTGRNQDEIHRALLEGDGEDATPPEPARERPTRKPRRGGRRPSRPKGTP